MMLCDAAQVADGKLYVLGGGWSLTGPDPMPSAIALKIDVGWHEAESAHHWELFLEDADGRPVMVDTPEGDAAGRGAGRVQRGPPAGRSPRARRSTWPWPSTSARCPSTPGTRYTWRLAIDGESSRTGSLGFTTRPDAASRAVSGPATDRYHAMTTYDRPFGRYFEDFEPGDIYRHWPGKTITEDDDHLFCMITMNHHPLHTNAWFAEHETVQGRTSWSATSCTRWCSA